MTSCERIDIYGVPMDLGANLRGVDMGPTALRIAGIEEALASLGYEVHDHDEVELKSRVALPRDSSSAKYVEEIVKVCGRLHDIAREAMARPCLPIFLGGDHSIAAGTIAGVSRHFRDRGQTLGVIWFDAHADMNTPETSPSGNVHGMPLSALIGYGDPGMTTIGGLAPAVDPEHVVIIGARDVDDNEKRIVAESGVTVFSMKEIDILGMGEVTRRALEIAGSETDGIHLSFDIDGLDPDVAPGVGTPVRGGVSFREAHLFMELLADSGLLVAMDLVELNPVRDECNRTAEAVVHLVQSAFGRAII
ncbi:MAG: arginase [Planctomycetes bacterium]|nr:arginase [Planctomycetota bacterium]